MSDEQATQEVRWQDRLTFDPAVSDLSPVVRGTFVTVAQLVSLIVDGWSWDDILANYPELNRNDIRACLAYALETGDIDSSYDERASSRSI